MPAAEVLDATWRAVPETVPTARHAVRAYLSAAETSDPPSSDIALAVSEAVTNVVQHAYAQDDPGSVRVRVEIHEREVEVMVQDDGAGVVPRPDSPGIGLGLPLIATISERFDVRKRRGGGTRVCIWFLLDPDAATLDD
ncbi:MAG TPA: ATP-binding protein [Solirubrobacteraceae bacterium]|nr:ATP-binding protein [Solirubrobacteraceae bacterium]